MAKSKKEDDFKMIDVTLSIPDKIGPVYWVVGENGIYGTDEFDNLDTQVQVEVTNRLADTFSNIRVQIVCAMIMAAVTSLSDAMEDYFDMDEDGGALH